MTTYQVTIDFKKGSSFATQVDAVGERSAELLGIRLARECGFDAPVKKSVATPVSEPHASRGGVQ